MNITKKDPYFETLGQLNEFINDKYGFYFDLPAIGYGENFRGNKNGIVISIYRLDSGRYELTDYVGSKKEYNEFKKGDTMSENRSIVKAVLDGNWAHLKDVADTMIVNSLEARINEKKSQIIASINEAAEEKSGGTLCGKVNSKVTDGGEHFPINDLAHAKNALARVAQTAKHEWWDGTKEDLIKAVHKAVKAKFPSIEVTEE